MNIEGKLGYSPVRAIVTGGAGFIGSHLVDALLERGDAVTVIDSLRTGRREHVAEGAHFVHGNFRGPETLEALFRDARPDVCFHLAAQVDVRVSIENPLFDCGENVYGTVQILEEARSHGTKVVFASTGGAMYGECAAPADEDRPPEPLAPYAVSKLAAEQYLAAYNRLHGTSHVSLRYGNVYGPRQDPHGEAGVVAIFFGRLARGESLLIFGDGRQTRDYVYVADVVAATLAGAEGPTGVFNIGTGSETSVLELAVACRRAAGVESETVFEPARAGELQRSFLDPTRAKEALGFRTSTSLDEGLAATWEFVRDAEGEHARGAN
jgi:UDP-glucose 4-epimerase